MYADLDTECLLPYDSIFAENNVSMISHNQLDRAQKPISNIAPTRKAFLGLMGSEETKEKDFVPNAWMVCIFPLFLSLFAAN